MQDSQHTLDTITFAIDDVRRAKPSSPAAKSAMADALGHLYMAIEAYEKALYADGSPATLAVQLVDDMMDAGGHDGSDSVNDPEACDWEVFDRDFPGADSRARMAFITAYRAHLMARIRSRSRASDGQKPTYEITRPDGSTVRVTVPED